MEPVTAMLRQAVRGDVREIQRVRHSVRENRLISRTIADEEVVEAIERTGKGWVVEAEGRIVGFAVGNAETGNIWALFVEPGHERRGHGRRLHDAMIGWLWSRGLAQLWLTTGPQTRAQRFYEQAGWENRGMQPSGELLFERHAASRALLRPTLKDRIGLLKRETHAMVVGIWVLLAAWCAWWAYEAFR